MTSEINKETAKASIEDAPGVNSPIEAVLGDVAITAWRDTDHPDAPASYFLEIKIGENPPHEILGLRLDQIRNLGHGLISIQEFAENGGHTASLVKKP